MDVANLRYLQFYEIPLAIRIISYIAFLIFFFLIVYVFTHIISWHIKDKRRSKRLSSSKKIHT